MEIELRDIQQQLQNTQASYTAHIASLKERISQLEAMQGEVPDAMLNEAIEALKQGKTQQADQLFQQIETDNKDRIKLVAEAAFQRGKIAQETVRYRHALEHYEKAARLTPDNTLYLNEAGRINHALAFYKKATAYYELALASGLKTYGEDHPKVAIRRNNLGAAWHALEKYDEAIDYYELALASDLKTYGEDHPDVARVRNNLGLAWNSLGKYDKAIDYYELALAIFEKILGNGHPSTQTVRTNLEAAQAEMAAAGAE